VKALLDAAAYIHDGWYDGHPTIDALRSIVTRVRALLPPEE
jgi:hypothetical protein